MRLRGIVLSTATVLAIGLFALPTTWLLAGAQPGGAAGKSEKEVRLRGTILKLAKLSGGEPKRYSVTLGDMMEIEADYAVSEAGTVFAAIEAGTSVAFSPGGFRTISDAERKEDLENRRAVVLLEALSGGESIVKVASGRLANTYIIEVRIPNPDERPGGAKAANRIGACTYPGCRCKSFSGGYRCSNCGHGNSWHL
jgi:hypothetical protein